MIKFSRWRTPRFLQSPSSKVGLGLLVVVVLLAIVGPLVAPFAPDKTEGAPGQPPGGKFLLGTDILGRDVLTRVLHGGLSVLLMAVAATALAYVVGLTVGMLAGAASKRIDALLMRTVDVFVVFPALLIVLLSVVAFGHSAVVIVCAVALLQAPMIARVVRTATLEVAGTGYVEAASGRGDSLLRIYTRDLLPNISGPVTADFGLRFTYSILIIASVNYLGLGLAPPKADWGLMISENRQVITTNPVSVLVPALLIAVLTIAVNLVGDAFARSLGYEGVTIAAETSLDTSPVSTQELIEPEVKK
jgi:ABC-type dipeptide/oligopeptide/nickel transport system permease subunit